jgi:hypothetical protein
MVFARGASLPDPDKLFNAMLEGNRWRAIKSFEGDKINEPSLKNLICAALALSPKTASTNVPNTQNQQMSKARWIKLMWGRMDVTKRQICPCETSKVQKRKETSIPCHQAMDVTIAGSAVIEVTGNCSQSAGEGGGRIPSVSPRKASLFEAAAGFARGDCVRRWHYPLMPISSNVPAVTNRSSHRSSS